MVTKPEQKDAEVRHVKSTLKANGYKEWAFKIPPPPTQNKSDTSRNTTGEQARTSVGLPYIRGTSEKLARIFKKHSRSRGLPQALQHPALHPGPPQRQDTWSQKVWCRLWNPVSRMPCPVCQWNCPHTGDKDERPPKTEVSTDSCGRTWTSHQNGRCQVITREDNMWRRKIRESIEIRTRHPAINHDQGYELPPSMTNCCHATSED